MAIEHVRLFFRNLGEEHRIMELDEPTPTVATAAAAHGVEPGRIGKTLSFKIDGEPLLIVTAGDAKVSNAKYKARFAAKARMLNAEEVVEHTGHPVGGVCPFGLPRELPVYLDDSLRRFEEVIPAAGSLNSSIRLSLGELERYSNAAGWVDVCDIPD